MVNIRTGMNNFLPIHRLAIHNKRRFAKMRIVSPVHLYVIWKASIVTDDPKIWKMFCKIIYKVSTNGESNTCF